MNNASLILSTLDAQPLTGRCYPGRCYVTPCPEEARNEFPLVKEEIFALLLCLISCRNLEESMAMNNLTSNTTTETGAPKAPPEVRFDWPVCYQAEELLSNRIDD